MEKYMINNLEEFAWSLAETVKGMRIEDIMKDPWTLREEIEAFVRGCPNCSEMKPKKTTNQ